MDKGMYRWKIKSSKKLKNASDIVSALLINRGVKSKKEQKLFFEPKHPDDITLTEVGLQKKTITKLLRRIDKALKNDEHIVIYGDYDADGITATAILWESLYSIGCDVAPFIPDRFADGYGLNANSVDSIYSKNKNLALIITVDNGVVAHEGVEKAKQLGIDVFITDHHEKGEKYPKANGVIHSQLIGGAGVAWFVAREIYRNFSTPKEPLSTGLDLAAIGTVADQIPLIGANRSIVKYGIGELNVTSRIGLHELYNDARLKMGEIDGRTIGFAIAPRLNAMGRLEHAIESLRLLCTKNPTRAQELAKYLSKTNRERQKVVEDVLTHAEGQAEKQKNNNVIILAHESYHEGVVGLAASKIVEKYHRPTLVFSKSNEESKASARSINGFNIIKNLRKLESMLLSVGGHPMAAGVKISTSRLPEFSEALNELAQNTLTKEDFIPLLLIDLEIDLSVLSWNLLEKLSEFAPVGSGNREPLFCTKGVRLWDMKLVGSQKNHLKMVVKKEGATYDAIGFGLGDIREKLEEGVPVDIAYYFEENIFNGVKSMQLRIKDIAIT